MSEMHYILIIDDNEDHLFILRKILEAENYHVDTVSTYDEIHSHLNSFKYDVILLDIVLKDKNGIEILNELVETYGDLTVIVMSAFGDDQEIVKAIKDGAIDYISKTPGFEARILDSVRKNIEHKELKLEIEKVQAQYEQLFEVANDFMFTLDLF
jgi:DNA-binding NtrC family response regulator